MKHRARRFLHPLFNKLNMDLDVYRDARQCDDEVAARSLQREIMRQFHAELLAEVEAIGPMEVLRRIRIVAQEPTESGAFARRVLRQLMPAAFA
jgi:hypothetical protein